MYALIPGIRGGDVCRLPLGRMKPCLDCLVVVVDSDPVSGIKVGEVGLGRSRRDTYLLPWTTVQNYSHVEHKFRVPDGVPAWVKMRVTNNGQLSFLAFAS